MNNHSTWRSLLPVLEDQPLALCDSHSVGAADLMPTDRLVPDRVGEVYYLKYNPKHRWSVSPIPVNTIEWADSNFFVGIGYPHKRAPSRMYLLCMTRKLEPMLDVSAGRHL
jgi:hypothetical protein